ncbi:proprotein convertase subtilisin/kexin type 7 isoform X1 [Marmota marmota marmota]|uniref:proprotein convertase subtilisin/kexin type 7 isoform X1 n=1 Tax=Marmota marmota marmota TaxID=9994 RepID=UPI00209369BA|nr:proprotein convertase subtilisin/kexin type 7 isoform X1 [Marmota marmota marmota]XP_048651801.1 proprotein convertase subtilisin/kexin type 7 isoform X1 [Marmota marmota marmota]XP_048651802.1 proprotein convertase subtilisin/kexin type 7 isoform X1 [Marmota marmota marmota]
MPKGRQKVPHLDAPLGLPTCLWLELAGLFLLVPWVMGLAGTGGLDAQGTGGLSWAVHLDSLEGEKEEENLEQRAHAVAQAAGLVNAGRIGELQGHYLFVQPVGHKQAMEAEVIRQQAEAVLARHEAVRWHSEQRLLKRTKRSVHFNDPKYPQQWHLNNRRSPGRDINVTGVWERNVTGQGVTVVVVDDGVEHTIQDIAPNYSPEGSYDLNSNDPDPMPHPDVENGNHHGTRCAGEIAAVPNNSFCAVGVAYGSRIAGIRVLDGPLTDSMEAVAFNKHYQINDIYSCSWGPDDDGKTVDGPHQLGKAALQHGVMAGRQGFGSIFVVASGNGGQHNDNCNYDGYANSIYTVTIGAVDEEGRMPFYAEECASMLAVTFSGGDKMLRSIVTTDWDLQKGTGCTEGHTGTSAAAPLAAGMIALMLQVRPCLTWRDVQHIIVFTATQYEDRRADWLTNEAGFSHSHQHGFGLLNAWRLVNAAKIWTSVPYLASYVSPVLKENKAIPRSPGSLEVLWNGSGQTRAMAGEGVAKGGSPGGRKEGAASLGWSFRQEDQQDGPGDVRTEDPGACGSDSLHHSPTTRQLGTETVLPQWHDVPYRRPPQHGLGSQWLQRLDLLHCAVLGGEGKRHLQTRYQGCRLLESAMSGKYLHDGFALPCPPGLTIPEEDGYTITPNTLKTLVLVGCFTIFWTIYYMLEVYLSQRNVASTPGCRSGPCHWPQQSRKSKEEGTELESVPLCNSKDLDGAETERGSPSTTSGLLTSDLLDEEDWSISQNKNPQHQPLDLLQGKEEQIC